MLSQNFKAAAQSRLQGDSITAGKEKLDTEMLTGEELTISDLEARKGEDGKKYYAVIFEEHPDHFIFSGTALTNLIAEAEDAGEDIRGEKIIICEKKKTKSGRWFTPVELI